MPQTSALRKAGNGREQVNVISWSKQPEIAQLSNFAAVSMELEFSRADLLALGMETSAVEVFCAHGPAVIICGSVEGFVQALKTSDVAQQHRIALEHGKEAKRAGSAVVNVIDGGKRLCFLLGMSFPYASAEHRALIEYSIWRKFQVDESSRAAIEWTADARLTHNLGKFDPKPGKTSLPKQVFTRILAECRAMVRGEISPKSLCEILQVARMDSLEETQWYLPVSA